MAVNCALLSLPSLNSLATWAVFSRSFSSASSACKRSSTLDGGEVGISCVARGWGWSCGGGSTTSGGTGRTGEASLVVRGAFFLRLLDAELDSWLFCSSACLSRRRSSERGSSPFLFTGLTLTTALLELNVHISRK